MECWYDPKTLQVMAVYSSRSARVQGTRSTAWADQGFRRAIVPEALARRCNPDCKVTVTRDVMLDVPTGKLIPGHDDERRERAVDETELVIVDVVKGLTKRVNPVQPAPRPVNAELEALRTRLADPTGDWSSADTKRLLVLERGL